MNQVVVYCALSCVINSTQYTCYCTDVRDEGHRSPLHLACLGGHKDVAQYLVEEAKCDVSKLTNFVNGLHIH